MPFVVIALCWGVETLKNAAASSGCFGRKSTRRLEKCAVLAEFSASTAQNRGKPQGFSRYAEPPLNLVKQNSASTAHFWKVYVGPGDERL